MRRPLFLPLALLPLALLVFSGCSAPAPAQPEPPPEESVEIFSLPETRRLEPLSAPGIVTEGRTPAEDRTPALPKGDRDYHGNMMRWVHENTAELVAPGACFYALPRTEVRPEAALILWGERAAEFDWNFSTPRMFLPEMDCFDLDGDGEDELVILCCSGSGTGVSVWDLHVVEKQEDGTLTDEERFVAEADREIKDRERVREEER